MALVNCPECGREKVSQSATCCPSCGYDIKAHFNRIQRIEKRRAKSQRGRSSRRTRIRKMKLIIFALISITLVCCIAWVSISKYTDQIFKEFKIALNNFQSFSYTAFDSAMVTMNDVIEYEKNTYNCEEYKESTGKVGTYLYFDNDSRHYLFRNGYLDEYTYIINSESEFNNAVSEMTELFGAPENDMVKYIWLGNIGKHPVKIWIYDTSSLNEEFEAWIAIMYVDD